MADKLVDTAGINVHLNFMNTPYYTNFNAIYYALQGLGVRHARDLMSDLGRDRSSWYYQRHDELANLGIKTIYVASSNDSTDLALAYPSLVDDFEGYEGLNEYDNSGNSDWINTVTNYQKQLYQAIKSNSATSQYPVLGPSLVNAASYLSTAGLQSYMDYASLHNYFQGSNPGSGSIVTAVTSMQAGWGNEPVYTTETGYIYQTYMHITRDVGAAYAPRMLLEQFLCGIHRTYVYELMDTDSAQFGLMDSDLTPKPAYTALSNFLNLLTDRGNDFTTKNLDFSFTGNTTNLHHLLMQKRDGSLWLAVWIESKIFDQVSQAYLYAPTQPVTLNLTSTAATATVYQFDWNGNYATTSAGYGSSFSLNPGPNVMVIKLT